MIKAIIFDLGGVIQGIDWSFVVNSLLDIKEDLDIDTYRGAFYFDRENYLDKYMVSKISKEDYWGKVAQRLDIDKEHINKLSESLELLYSFINKDILDLIKTLKNNYKIFALSNMCPELEKKMIEDNQYVHLFDKLYLSHKTGLKKPDKESYLSVVNENELKPEECVFIDNDIKNTKSAEEIGMNTILIKNPNLLKKDLFFLIERFNNKKDILVGYATGVFDLFHQGHLNLLRNAKRYCDKLIVGITTDKLSLYFKNKLPVMGLKERMEIVQAIKHVDEVVVQEDMDKFEAWKKYKFDVIFESNNPTEKWPHVKEKFLKKFKELGLNPPKMIKLDYTPNVSSTLRREILKND